MQKWKPKAQTEYCTNCRTLTVQPAEIMSLNSRGTIRIRYGCGENAGYVRVREVLDIRIPAGSEGYERSHKFRSRQKIDVLAYRRVLL